MKRTQFEHTIRAAGAILGVDTVLVIGSQAIHASYNGVLPEAERSIEVDIAFLDDVDDAKADLLDGSIGELSLFQETFGYYAHGVSPKTAQLPHGWRKRLVRFRTPSTQGITALCLELHDLWISKAIAGRPKDVAFCTALLQRRLVKPRTLRARLQKVHNLEPALRATIVRRIGQG